MSPYRHMELRIDRLLARAARHRDAPAAVEMEDLLATGYAYALQGDARCRRLRRRVDELAEDVAAESAAVEMLRLAREQRALEDSTRLLRTRLEAVRTLLMEA